ncbi:MAG: toxin-activating lysine-acyltransferase [Rhodospirillales bacterium]|nr:toxin-activating lysine-acyltransferase [Rhodospirillales bacterium]
MVKKAKPKKQPVKAPAKTMAQKAPAKVPIKAPIKIAPKSPAKTSAAPASAPVTTASPGRTSRAEILGDVAWLMIHSANHRRLFVSDLEWMLLPPILAGQFRLVRQGPKPLAFVSWALFNEATEKLYCQGNVRLRPPDWTSGDRPWIVELVSPFAPPKSLMDRIKKDVFPDRPLKVLTRGPDGKSFTAREISAIPTQAAKGNPGR